jgi:arginine decarboxylase
MINWNLKCCTFISGINDTTYYWNELVKCIKVYRIKKNVRINSLNIGGGFHQNSLAFEYDYQYMIDEIINQIKIACDEIDVPHIFTEWLVLLLRRSGGAKFLYQETTK